MNTRERVARWLEDFWYMAPSIKGRVPYDKYADDLLALIQGEPVDETLRDHEAMEKLRRLSVPDPHVEADLGMFWEFTTNKLGEAALWGCPDRSKNDPADAILEADDG